MTFAYLEADAHVSADGKYRYSLTRSWDSALPALVFVMLNPSTADGKQDDPTIRRCVGFARTLGFGSIVVLNLFAWRATQPTELFGTPDPIGPDNDAWFRQFIGHAAVGMVIAAWGSHVTKKPWMRDRARRVLELLTEHGDVHALRISVSGMPEHPLYLPGNLKPVLFRERRRAA